jgi:hypothetical protein
VKEYFGVADGITTIDTERSDKIGGDFGIPEALDDAAMLANEVGMLMGRGFVRANAITPDTILTSDAVEDTLTGEGVEGAVDGNGIGVRREFPEDFDSTEGACGFEQYLKDAATNRRTAELGALEQLRNRNILHGCHYKAGRRQ